MTDTALRDASIPVFVNGEGRRLPPGTTLGGLLRSLDLDPRMVVIEHNRTILRDRAEYGALVLAPGDVLEIVHFVGGG